MKSVIEDFYIQANVSKNAHVEIKQDNQVIFSTLDDIDNLDDTTIKQLEKAHKLSVGTTADISNIRVVIRHNNQVQTTFAIDNKGVVTTNLGLQSPSERLNNITNRIKGSPYQKAIFDVVSNITKTLEMQTRIAHKQADTVRLLQNRLEKHSLNLKGGEKIAQSFIQIAKENGGNFLKEGKQYTVRSSANGKVRIWRKNSDTGELIYAQTADQVQLNALNPKDIENLGKAVKSYQEFKQNNLPPTNQTRSQNQTTSNTQQINPNNRRGR